jgi:phosphate transport system substrate-binding protein
MKRVVPLVRVLPLVALAIAACGGGADRVQRAVIQNKGSDTLLNVAQAWAEAYGAINPSVAVAVTGGGSGTGISAMINGTVDIANSSRKMRDAEIGMARENGVEPVEFIVGYDALAVYLHADNPIKSLTLAQLRAVYGDGGSVESWSGLGVSVPGCGSDEIVVVSRQNNSGTYVHFKEAVLGDDMEYKLGSRDMHGSKDVVDLVENTPCAIGYSGLAYATEHVNMPCISAEEGGSCVAPTITTAVDGSYLIARPLMMYTAGQPQGVIEEYMNWILSTDGQCLIVERGYAPVTDPECA